MCLLQYNIILCSDSQKYFSYSSIWIIWPSHLKKKYRGNIDRDYLMQCGLKLLKEDKYVKHDFDA